MDKDKAEAIKIGMLMNKNKETALAEIKIPGGKTECTRYW
jgi:hypothetical protein